MSLQLQLLNLFFRSLNRSFRTLPIPTQVTIAYRALHA